MAKSFSELVKSRRDRGGSITGSISYGIKERLKEKFDPRRMINQKGLLTSLFPSLRSYQAGGSKTGQQLNSPSMMSESLTSLEPVLESISINTKLSAKNSMVLPMMHRDINVIRQNMAKLVKLEGGTPASRADMFFMKSRDRQAAYDVQSKSKKSIKPTPKKDENSFLGTLLSGILSGIKAIGLIITSGLAKLGVQLPKIIADSVTNLAKKFLSGMSILTSIGGLLGNIGGLKLKAMLLWAMGLYIAGKQLGKVDFPNRLKNKESRIVDRAIKEIPQNMQYGNILKPDEARALLESGDEKLITSYGGKERVEKMAKGEAPGPLPIKESPNVAPDKSRGFWNRFFLDWKQYDPKSGGEKYKDIKGRSDAARQSSVDQSEKNKKIEFLESEKKKLEPLVGPKSTIGRQRNPESAKNYDAIDEALKQLKPQKSGQQLNLEEGAKNQIAEKKQSKLLEMTSKKSSKLDVVPVIKNSGNTIDVGSKQIKSQLNSQSNGSSEVNVNNNNNNVNKTNQIQVIPSAYDPTITTKFRGIPVVVPRR